MSYDHWKTTDPDDKQHQDPPCEESPKVDDDDICLWCGADPTQACQWHKS